MRRFDYSFLDNGLLPANLTNLTALIYSFKTSANIRKEEFNKISQTYRNIGYKVIKTNAKEKIGIQKLEQELKDNISAFSGNSGVGKSTLINDLFNENITEEGEISQKNKRGKNTTTHIKLYELNKDTYIADTPGFSTFDVYEIPYKELDKYFVEFKNGIENCRYIGCSHIKEDECGVKDLIEENKIDRQRYENYIKIYEELKDKDIIYLYITGETSPKGTWENMITDIHGEHNMSEFKTNVMRILDKAKITYKAHTYDHSDGAIDGAAVAEKMGQNPEQVFKTLVTKGAGRDYYVFVVPVLKELDLKKAAKAVGEKHVEMIHVKDINKVTGYIRGGCSPIGMKKQFVTVFDKSAENIETIIVSAGKIGYQIELAPKDLIEIVGAKTAEITAD